MDENEPLEIAVDVADDSTGVEENPIAELQRQKTVLERQLQSATERAAAAERTAAANYSVAADNYAAGAEAAAATARQQFTAALEAGDWSKLATANEELLGAKMRLMEAAQLKQQQRAQPAQAPAGNDVDTFISRLNGPSRDWAERHKADIANRLDEVGAAHVLAAKRHGVDNQNYFSDIERTLGIRGNNSRRSSAPVVAPVSSGNVMSGHGTMSGGTVRLSPGQVEMANSGAIKWNKADVAAGRCKPHQLNEPIGTREYGRRVLQMQRDGRMREPD